MEKSAIISRYFPKLSNKQQSQFRKIGPLYEHWNTQLNLISRKDITQLYVSHVLHALSIAKVITCKPGTKILDVGTGGGFPGIPLAILFPAVQFHLMDSIGKKIKAVEAIAASLSLKNVHTKQARAETVHEQYDFIVGRAVAKLPIFYNWVKDLLIQNSQNTLPNGILYLKGGKFLDELKKLPLAYCVYPIRHFFTEPFFETKNLIHLYHHEI